jgi:hypothetical protein
MKMKKLLTAALMMSLLVMVGCSDDDDTNPAGPNPPPPATHETAMVNASDYDNYMGFSFTTNDTTRTLTGTGWDVAFRREVVMVNGGSSSSGGDAADYDLGAVDFASVTIADTTGVSWESGSVEYFVGDWYDYNPVTHQLTANMRVYSMVDAEGDNYIKFRIDSLVGAGSPPDMGTVHITYYYQPTAGSTNLTGATTQAAITVGMTTAYFDFSTGAVVTPADPTGSTEWDLGFSAYNVMQNSGPTGTGQCEAFLAYTELTDETDIDEFIQQPAGAPMFEDIPASSMTDWYDYQGAPTHTMLSHEHVYLIRSGGHVYKLMIENYYINMMGAVTSGWYTFIWEEL